MTYRLLLALLALFLTLGSPHSADAQAPPTAEQIIERLKSGEGGTAAPARRTRGLSVPPGSAGTAPGYSNPPEAVSAPGAPIVPQGADAQAIERIFSQPAPGSLSVKERDQVAAIAKVRPAIDLTIYFDFNSAEISPRAVATLLELGKALSSDALAGTRFLLAGHTDAKGTDAYNLRLSQRRSEAIRKFLVEQFKVEERRLLAVGYGEEQLKNKSNPDADENRRVQVVNFGG